MTPKRTYNKKPKRNGWEFRFTHPQTGKRIKKTFWIGEKQEAWKAYRKYLDELEALKQGVGSNTSWKTPYPKLVEEFLVSAPINTEKRRYDLRRWLEPNPLDLQIAADLKIKTLNLQCKKLLTDENWTADKVLRLQRSLKQMTRYLDEIDVLPFNPLASWRKLPLNHQQKKRRAFLPDLVRELLVAAKDYDNWFGRKFPSTLPIQVLLFTGNRPGVLYAAKVKDIDWEKGRIVLPAGNGKKRNGMAYLPKEFLPELRLYLKLRKSKDLNAPLLVSHLGEMIDHSHFRKDFKRALGLALVRRYWPENNPLTELADPAEVAYRIFWGRVKGFDGVKPKSKAKLEYRQKKMNAIESLAEELEPAVEREMEGRDLYSLRKTHITWARRIANTDSVKCQVGHAPQDVEEKYYLDPTMVDASESAEAVWKSFNKGVDNTIEREEKRRVAFAVGGGNPEFVVPDLAPKETNSKGNEKLEPVALFDGESYKIGAKGFEPSASCSQSQILMFLGLYLSVSIWPQTHAGRKVA